MGGMVIPCQGAPGTSSPARVNCGPYPSGAVSRGLRLQDDARAGEDGYGRLVRLSSRHWTALDYAVGALFGVILLSSVRYSVTTAVGPPFGALPYGPLALTWPLAVFLVFTAVMAVALRRRRPFLMLGLLLAGCLIITMLTGPTIGALTYFLPVAYVLYLVAATYERRRAAVRVLAAVFATLAADAELMSLEGGGFIPHGGLVFVALCVIIAWFTGYLVRQRRRYAVRLQDEAASKAVAEERLRIARELHDVVAHSMSVIAVQAGYGQYVIDSQPADARNALGAIQATSREALDEMRRMLGALRQADQAEASGLADLDRLLARTASAGVRVDVTRCGVVRELPPSIDLSAYRIVQEALTNVVKHARAGSCQVLIGYGQDELTVEVTDNGAGVPALVGAEPGGLGESSLGGHGLIGMRERVTLLGGEFFAGPRSGYGFGVVAHIPLPAGSS
jgi:signal transduction histidine kinase